MEYMTIRQLAEDQHVTYEAIRRQLTIYRKELDGHIYHKNNMKLLDEYAVNFLRQRRRQSPVVAYNQDREVTIDALKNELLKSQNMVTQLQQQLDALKDQRRNMIETETRYQMALEQLTQKDKIIEQAEQKADDAKAEAYAAQQALTVEREKHFQTRNDLNTMTMKFEMAEKESNSYHKTIFGFYRKKG